jgi:hypothetical protein
MDGKCIPKKRVDNGSKLLILQTRMNTPWANNTQQESMKAPRSIGSPTRALAGGRQNGESSQIKADQGK